MLLEKIHLINFKNYEFLEMTFGNGLNCILGNNGSGKTNLLDAIYCLAFTKSYFGLTDIQNIRHSENFLVVNGSFKKEYHLDNDDLDNNLVEFQNENKWPMLPAGRYSFASRGDCRFSEPGQMRH